MRSKKARRRLQERQHRRARIAQALYRITGKYRISENGRVSGEYFAENLGGTARRSLRISVTGQR